MYEDLCLQEHLLRMYENRYLKNLQVAEYNLRYLHIYVKTSFMVTKIHLHKRLLNYLMKATDPDCFFLILYRLRSGLTRNVENQLGGLGTLIRC